MIPNRIQLEALLRVRSNPDFVDFCGLVKDTIDDQLSSLEVAQDPPVIYRLQGGVTALRKLIKLVDEAPTTLDKLKSKEKTP